MRKKKDFLSRIYVFFGRRETTIVKWKLPLCRTFGVVPSGNTSMCFTVPCHTFCDKIGPDKPQITRKRAKETVNNQEIIQSIRKSCFDPKASFSCLLKLTPLMRALDCHNSYCAGYDWITRNSNKQI